MKIDELAIIVEEQRLRRGMSMADVSRAAFGGGNSTVVQNLKRGIAPTFKTLTALCSALDLELYIGPPREPVGSDTQLADDDTYAEIPLHDALLSAGPGADNPAETVVENLAFRKDWLHRIGTTAAAARLARVHGDSMMPSICAGDMVLVDTSRTEPPIRQRSGRDQRRGSVYALIDNGEARVKRIERPSEDTMILISDNPDYAPEFRSADELAQIQIVGKVVWWGHTARD